MGTAVLFLKLKIQFSILVVALVTSCAGKPCDDCIPQHYLEKCQLVDGFDFPVGKPDAKGYYDAQSFGKNNHLGSDWNGNGGGNSDFGDDVFSIADGVVFLCRKFWWRMGKCDSNRSQYRDKKFTCLC